MIRFKQKGDFSKLTGFLEQSKEKLRQGILDKYGKEGVEALAEATPKRTGLTAASWSYKIENKNGVAKLVFYNSNVQNGINIALIIQYGHGTSRGAWIEGRDYINPVIQALFDKIVEEALTEITKI